LVVQPEVTLYPNPAGRVIHVKGLKMRHYQAYTLFGQLSYEGALNENRIDCESWKQGWYVIRLRDETGNFSMKKILISK